MIQSVANIQNIHQLFAASSLPEINSTDQYIPFVKRFRINLKSDVLIKIDFTDVLWSIGRCPSMRKEQREKYERKEEPKVE